MSINQLNRLHKEHQLLDIVEIRDVEERRKAMGLWMQRTIADYHANFSMSKDAIEHYGGDTSKLIESYKRDAAFNIAEELLRKKVIDCVELDERDVPRTELSWSRFERRWQLELNVLTDGY